MDSDITLTDTPKSNMTFLIKVLSILQRIVNILESLHLGGSFLHRTANTFSPTIILSSPFNLLLLTRKSFKNFSYLGIYLIASNKEMLNSTLRNISRITFFLSDFFSFSNLLRKGGGLDLTLITESEITSSFTFPMPSSISF